MEEGRVDDPVRAEVVMDDSSFGNAVYWPAVWAQAFTGEDCPESPSPHPITNRVGRALSPPAERMRKKSGFPGNSHVPYACRAG